MRVVFVDEHERAAKSIDRIELMTFESAEARRTVVHWMAGRAADRLTAKERQALREAAEPELGFRRLTAMWPATCRRQADLKPCRAVESRLVAEGGAEIQAAARLPHGSRAVAAAEGCALDLLDHSTDRGFHRSRATPLSAGAPSLRRRCAARQGRGSGHDCAQLARTRARPRRGREDPPKDRGAVSDRELNGPRATLACSTSPASSSSASE